MWTLDHLRRCPPLLSPNVLLNEMTPEQQQAYHADYIRQGPAGRPAREGLTRHSRSLRGSRGPDASVGPPASTHAHRSVKQPTEGVMGNST